MLRRTRIKPRRGKPRPRRLAGEEQEALRLACFQRDGGRCVECGRRLIYEPESPFQENGYHMAHIGNKRMWGDNLENVRAKCSVCHLQKEHNAGGKPCPRKPRRDESDLHGQRDA